MIVFLRRLFVRRKPLPRDRAVDDLVAEMRQSAQVAKLQEHLIRRQREKTGNFPADTVFRRWEGDPT